MNPIINKRVLCFFSLGTYSQSAENKNIAIGYAIAQWTEKALLFTIIMVLQKKKKDNIKSKTASATNIRHFFKLLTFFDKQIILAPRKLHPTKVGIMPIKAKTIPKIVYWLLPTIKRFWNF